MSTRYEIKHNGHNTYLDTFDEVLSYINSHQPTDPKLFDITEIKSRDISEFVRDMAQNTNSMEEARSNSTKGQTPFNSPWLDEDFTLPYSPFDLLYGLKTIGELAEKLRSEGVLNEELMDDAFEQGYSVDYLKSLPIKDPYSWAKRKA